MRFFALFFAFFDSKAKNGSKNRIFRLELTEKRLELGEKRIATLSTTHLFGVSFVLLDHFLGLFGLMLVVSRPGLLEILFRLFFHLLHLPLGLTLGPRPA